MGQKTQLQIDPEAGSFNIGEKVAEKSNFQSNNLFQFFTYIYFKGAWQRGGFSGVFAEICTT